MKKQKGLTIAKHIKAMEKQIKEALKLSSTHDPEHEVKLDDLKKRVEELEKYRFTPYVPYIPHYTLPSTPWVHGSWIINTCKTNQAT